MHAKISLPIPGFAPVYVLALANQQDEAYRQAAIEFEKRFHRPAEAGDLEWLALGEQGNHLFDHLMLLRIPTQSPTAYSPQKDLSEEEKRQPVG